MILRALGTTFQELVSKLASTDRFRDMVNLLDPKKCNKIAMTLSSNLDKNYTKLQIEQFASSILIGKEQKDCVGEDCEDNAIKNIIDENNLVKSNCGLLIDGNDFKPYTYINDDDMIESIQSTLIVGGDALYSSIAAASIVAKYAHDTYILDLCRQYPKLDEYYNLSKNMGYGTKQHMEGILEYGTVHEHRKSYGPCKPPCTPPCKPPCKPL